MKIYFGFLAAAACVVAIWYNAGPGSALLASAAAIFTAGQVLRERNAVDERAAGLKDDVGPPSVAMPPPRVDPRRRGPVVPVGVYSSDLSAAINDVVRAWTIEGRSPAYHQKQKALLSRNWQPLFEAVSRLVRHAPPARHGPGQRN